MLDPERWQQIKEIFQAAMELPVAVRQEFIRAECGDDETLRSEVESMLDAHDEAGDFIAAPALTFVRNLVTDEPRISRIGQTFGAYRLEKEIGRGGMGAVYLAERADREFEKKVAIKLIKRGFDTDEIINRFRAERQILAALEHPNITRLIDGGATDDGLPYLVMDYVEGLPLTKYADENRLSIEERLKLFLQICAAVSYAHQNLIIHRDLKPSNILVTADGVPKLLDFGIAKLTVSNNETLTAGENTATRAMTPEYASPEQLLGQTVTTAADIYSLGVVLYELLTGTRPFRLKNHSAEEISRIITESEPLRPSAMLSRKFRENSANPKSKIQNPKLLRGDLDNIILMAMRKESARRYSSVEQFAGDIRRYLNGLPVIAREDTFSYRASKFVTRNKAGVAAGTGILLSLVGGLGATVYQARKTRRQRDKAERINKFLQKMLASADPRAQGKDVKVVRILELALQNIEKDFADTPEIAADLRTTIGLTFLSLGQLDSAETHLRAALEIRKALFGIENHETALSLNNFGRLRQAKGELHEAEKLFRQALAVLRRAHRADVLDIASVLGNLGYLLMLEAKYEEAKNAHYEELEILRGHLGEDHPDFARTLSNLANIYSVTGAKQTAEPLHRQALGITQKFYGGEHPDVALAMLHLAITISARKPDEAENLFRRTLGLRRRFFGDGHTETAWSLYYLGDILHRKGDYEQAADCAREILSWRILSIPDTHSVINSSLIMLARCYLATDRAAEAETLLRECLALRQKTLPPGHWLIATTKGYLAESFLRLERFAEAAPLLEESYLVLLEKLGADHEHTKQARKRLESFRRGSNGNTE